MIIEKDKESCKFKWNSMQKSFVVKSEWTDFEDECILKIYSYY